MSHLTGVLLIQLGTPDAPTTAAVRRYLRQFLSDPRVIEAPRVPWLLVLNTLILSTRPSSSARKYERIWSSSTGSPLLHYTRLQAEALGRSLRANPVRFGMQVGNPSVREEVRRLMGDGVERLIVMPMYPQYSATTWASATDALFQALMKERRVPAIRIVPPYYASSLYIDALTTVIGEKLASLPDRPDHFLISFHGLPVKYVERGDPYPEHVRRTTELMQAKLQWPKNHWTQTFQSRFGRQEWLQPYTDDVLVRLARAGAKRVFVVTPGFTADCLETLDEIGNESREVFRRAGGEELYLCPCLNNHPAWIDGMRQLILAEATNWL